MTDPPPKPHSQEPPQSWAIPGRAIAALFFAALLALGYLVVQSFVVPLLWAGILTYVAWPLHRWMHYRIGLGANLSALLITLVLSVLIVVLMGFGGTQLADELAATYRDLREWLAASPPQIPEFLGGIPGLGERLQELLVRVVAEPEVIRSWLAENAGQWVQQTREVLGAIGRNAFKLSFALLALFFFLRDGEQLVAQIQTVLQRWLGDGARDYWSAMVATTRGVVYGLVLTALAQGALAGFGYWVAGAVSPLLLGMLTALFALVPFGAPLIWGSTGIWLLTAGEVWGGIGVLVWGGLVVSMIDNVVRPLAISSATRIPFLVVFIGVLGGLQAFGLVGLFVGPVILAVMLAVWREWLTSHTDGGNGNDVESISEVSSRVGLAPLKREDQGPL